MADEAAVEAAVAAVVAGHGRLDAVVNNAGITRAVPLHKMTLADFRAVISVNLEGAFLLTRAALRHMRTRSGGGRVVNISSMSARLGNFGQANYAASKAGVIGLSKTLARELGRYQVNVNVVAPGLVTTPMTAQLPPEVVEAALKESALGHACTPEACADAIVFLCSAAARHIPGAVLRVDGGQYM